MVRCVFELKKNAVDRLYFVFKDPDNKTVVVSQSFPDRTSLETCILGIRSNAKIGQIVDGEDGETRKPFFKISHNSSGEYVFSMVGIDGETIMHSEGYKKKEACIESLETFKEYALDARILDLT